MSLHFSLCTNVCEKFSLKLLFKKKRKKDVDEILHDINILLSSEKFEKKFITNHILNKLVQLTGSEYGFIGKVMYENKQPVLYTYAITNIAWNASSHKFFVDHINTSLRFDNMDTLFGEVILEGKPLIINSYDYKRNILPDGHPMIKRFLGVPSVLRNKTITMVGMCNKLKKYNSRDVKNAQKVMKILGYLFIDLDKNFDFGIKPCNLDVVCPINLKED